MSLRIYCKIYSLKRSGRFSYEQVILIFVSEFLKMRLWNNIGTSCFPTSPVSGVFGGTRDGRWHRRRFEKHHPVGCICESGDVFLYLWKLSWQLTRKKILSYYFMYSWIRRCILYVFLFVEAKLILTQKQIWKTSSCVCVH